MAPSWPMAVDPSGLHKMRLLLKDFVALTF
jgi:hypothetical protein